ncbi:hypothetical protein [Marinobacterium sediminicola]|uniref:Transmembrane protein n=1 Tax=Marinobacterium sediminicola TaxID=518898 RepID=A0ABY1S4S3_9GAMM|nr:hypothetical protein [Marinobacterium sediminicola]ULG68926.1 hypothetical protein LN244_14755 [Marinobacterium sediminicola]SMR78429.1 hypothetical protein SAMN04487964_1235 [Marinobacterium sediminicola]
MNSNRRVFWLIWGVGLVPVILAMLAWVSGVGIPDRGVNHGELVQPVRTIDQWGGELDRHTGHWSLVLVHESSCPDGCNDRLEALKRVHDALGREADRVRVDAKLSGNLNPGIWVVDPLGNLVLKHPLSFEGDALLTDMRRLLKASRLG